MPGGGQEHFWFEGDMNSETDSWRLDSGTGRYDQETLEALKRQQFGLVSAGQADRISEAILDIRGEIGGDALGKLLETLLYWNKHSDFELANEEEEDLRRVIKDYQMLNVIWFQNRLEY